MYARFFHTTGALEADPSMLPACLPACLPANFSTCSFRVPQE